MDKRQAIIEAATELFAVRGFHGTPVPSIAEKAGVAVGTIYRHFPDKERLASEAYCHWKSAATKAVLAVYNRVLAPREQFGRSWRAMCAFALEHSAAIRFTEMQAGPYLDEPAHAACRRYDNLLLEFCRSIAPDDQTARLKATAVNGVFLGMLKAIWEEELPDLADILNSVEEICWNIISEQ